MWVSTSAGEGGAEKKGLQIKWPWQVGADLENGSAARRTNSTDLPYTNRPNRCVPTKDLKSLEGTLR